MQPQQPQALDYIKYVAGCWDPKNPACQFKYYFYNMVHPSEVSLYQPAQGEDRVLYEQAQMDNPDPSCMVPVLAVGFEGLKTRLEIQDAQLKIHKEKIQEFKSRLEKVERAHTVETIVKIEQYKRKQSQIAHKILQLMKAVQILRNKGYSLRAEEEAFMTRLISMDRDLAKPSVFRGRINEIYAHVQQQKDANRLVLGAYGSSSGDEGFTLADPEALKPVIQALEEIGKGLAQLTQVINEDDATIEKLAKGYQDDKTPVALKMPEPQRIHYGSLETSERVSGGGAKVLENNFLFANQKKGVDFEALENKNQEKDVEKEKSFDEIMLEKKQLTRTLAIPTDDQSVRNRLREMYEPMTLFGEGPMERRDRLKDLVAEKVLNGEEVGWDESSDEEDAGKKEETYSYGSDELREARRYLLDYSIAQARTRLKMHNKELEVPFADRKKVRHEWYTQMNSFETKSLQFGDDRPIGFCRFSPNAKLLATASWSGLLKLWSVPGSENLSTLRGHRDRVSACDFHPRATISQSPDSANLVSGSADGGVHLWSLTQDTPIGTLDGHDMRVARLAFHPSGRFVGTASFDTTWRLWDIETCQELLLQEGHSREVFALGFQRDGALAASAGLDSIGRVWDLRIGRSIMVLRSHIKPILALDWSPNGYQLATGGEDNTIRVWDIRAAKCFYTIPAHKSTVTQIRYWTSSEAFESSSFDGWTLGSSANSEMEIDGSSDADSVFTPGSSIRRQVLDGSIIVSSSYDGTCKLWTDGDYKPLKSLSGLEGRITCADISGDGKYIATSLYDRTFKLYGQ
ncbi:U4/U6 small nuclear ribonucleoprotein Prp4 [Kappamyces sp. JEL0829]|nr:U4/U6 small nuclear ribonucleoprotein Prp4 [Kappamyces sp. JEL0829]